MYTTCVVVVTNANIVLVGVVDTDPKYEYYATRDAGSGAGH